MIERCGGWDDETDHDEDSFNFRFAAIKREQEYFAYDPRPAILRRLDVPGGLGRRQQTVCARLKAELRFSHGVIRRYYPWRFWTLYPVYVLCALERACRHVLESRRRAELKPPPAAAGDGGHVLPSPAAHRPKQGMTGGRARNWPIAGGWMQAAG